MKTNNKKCKISGCEKGPFAKGLCKSHYNRAWYATNKAHKNAYDKARRSTPEYKEYMSSYHKAWYATNKAHKNAYDKARRSTPEYKEHAKAYDKAWHATNKAHKNAYNKARRARAAR